MYRLRCIPLVIHTLLIYSLEIVFMVRFCFSKREVFIQNQSHEAFYLRYFTFRESLRSSNPKDRKKQSGSLIRDDIALLMNGKGLDYQNDLLLYAYVDPGNMRSKRLIEEFGFNKISNFQIIPFSRIFPKNHRQVKLAENKQRAEIRKLLAESYKEEQLVSFENLFSKRRILFAFGSRQNGVWGAGSSGSMGNTGNAWDCWEYINEHFSQDPNFKAFVSSYV